MALFSARPKWGWVGSSPTYRNPHLIFDSYRQQLLWKEALEEEELEKLEEEGDKKEEEDPLKRWVHRKKEMEDKETEGEEHPYTLPLALPLIASITSPFYINTMTMKLSS